MAAFLSVFRQFARSGRLDRIRAVVTDVFYSAPLDEPLLWDLTGPLRQAHLLGEVLGALPLVLVAAVLLAEDVVLRERLGCQDGILTQLVVQRRKLVDLAD